MSGLNEHLLKRNDKRYEELNIFKWQEKGITGEGVKIAIIGENVGTHHNGAFLVRQVVPDAEVIELNIKVDDGTKMKFSEAFQYCIDNDVDVVCCNYLATHFRDDDKRLSKEMKDKGIIMLASSGNDYGKINKYPAACEYWFATGAYYMNGRANFSQYGPTLLCLGHTNYASITPAGDYIPISHTSGTIQVIAGMAAMLKQLKPDLTYKEFEEFVKEHAIRLSTENWNEEEGWGLLALPSEIPEFTLDNEGEDESMTEQFVDLNKDAWYYPAVKHAIESGSMKGKKGDDGKMYFEPSASLTRAEYAQSKYNEYLEGK